MMLSISRPSALVYTRLGPKNFPGRADQSSSSRSFGRIAQSATTIATTQKIPSNNNWLISLFTATILVHRHCFDAWMPIPKSVGYVQKNLAAALRMRDGFLDGRERVGCRYRNSTPPDAIISAACATAGALFAADSGWPSQKPCTVSGLKMTSSGLIDIGARLIAA